MLMGIKLAIVEDNTFLLKAILEKLSFFNDLEVKFTALNGEDFLEKLKDTPSIELVLMDIEMPRKNGIDTVQEISRLHPQIKSIMLTVFDDEEKIYQSILAGANGYLLKEVDPNALHQAIIDTMEGGAAMTPSVAMKALGILRIPVLEKKDKDQVSLTKREVDVLEQTSKGLNYHQIAENLFISPKTVRKHTENIYQKLQVHSKLEAVQKAVKNRII